MNSILPFPALFLVLFLSSPASPPAASEPVAAAAAVPADQFLKIKVKAQDQSEVFFKVKKTTPLVCELFPFPPCHTNLSSFFFPRAEEAHGSILCVSFSCAAALWFLVIPTVL
jgi:hypothetical protein